jgi:hypothetical protein
MPLVVLEGVRLSLCITGGLNLGHAHTKLRRFKQMKFLRMTVHPDENVVR